MPGRDPSRHRETMTMLLCAVTVAASLAALGGAPRWSTCLAVALALATAATQVQSRRAFAHIMPLAVLLAAQAILTAIQLVPLPAAVVAVLAPTKLELVHGNAAALGHGPPGWLALSYDPPATAVELAKLCGYIAFAIAAMRIAERRSGRRFLAALVAGAGVAMAACALIHTGLGIERVFGLYRPTPGASPLIAPLINANHLAGFLAAAAPLIAAMVLTTARWQRLAWLAGGALVIVTVLLTESRGGALVLLAGAIITAAFLLAQRRPRALRDMHARGGARLSLAVAVSMGIVAACTVVVIVALYGGGVGGELAGTSTAELGDPNAKPGVWRRGLELAGESPWTGVGRGGFEAAFTRYHHSGVKTYSHVENQYLQALIDWGVPGAALIAFLAVWTGLSLLRRRRAGPLEVGALGALLTLLLHNAADFNLELPGVAFAAIAAAGILAAPALETLPAAARHKRMLQRAAALALGTAALLLAMLPYSRSAGTDGRALAVMVAGAEPQEAIAEGRRLMARHPVDYLIAGLTAQAYFRQRDPRAVSVMNRALTLNPRHPGLHVLAARMLLVAGKRDQALIELELALRYTLDPGPVLADLVRFFPDPDDAARGIPIAAERLPVMTNRLITMQRPDIALAHARRALAADERSPELLQTVSILALERGELALAVDTGTRAFELRGTAADALALARALKAGGRVLDALAVLEGAVGPSSAFRGDPGTRARIHALLGELQEAQGRYRSAKESLVTAIALAGTTGADRALLAGFYRQLARIEDALGNPGRAAEARDRAGSRQ